MNNLFLFFCLLKQCWEVKGLSVTRERTGKWVSCLRQKVLLGIKPRISCYESGPLTDLATGTPGYCFVSILIYFKTRVFCTMFYWKRKCKGALGACVSVGHSVESRVWGQHPWIWVLHAMPLPHHGHRQVRYLLYPPLFSLANTGKTMAALGERVLFQGTNTCLFYSGLPTGSLQYGMKC